MWTYHPELLAKPVPRYTSYPTAAEFGDDVGGPDHAAMLAGVGADEALSLYLHIPFCHEICWYCGCNTGAANRTHRLEAYVEALKAELSLVAGRLDGRGRIGRIAFGGGSPNALAPERFLDLLEHVRTAFAAADPILSIEIDPRGFDADWAAALRHAGVSRASLGVQTFAPHVQAAIGRVQPGEEIARATELLRDAGVTSINFDMMYGLPGQSSDDLMSSLDQAIRLGADRMAVFGYAHVPHLIPRQRRIDASALPGAHARFEQAAIAYEKVTRAGYATVGFDHFALPGDALAVAAEGGTLRRNFQGFTEDPAETLIGFGATAISASPALLLQNEKNNGRYQLRVNAGQLPGARGIRRSPMDRRRGRMIEALLCTGTAELAGLPDLELIRADLTAHETLGLVEWTGTELRLMPEGLPYARGIAATIDPYRRQDATRFSSAV